MLVWSILSTPEFTNVQIPSYQSGWDPTYQSGWAGLIFIVSLSSLEVPVISQVGNYHTLEYNCCLHLNSHCQYSLRKAGHQCASKSAGINANPSTNHRHIVRKSKLPSEALGSLGVPDVGVVKGKSKELSALHRKYMGWIFLRQKSAFYLARLHLPGTFLFFF